VASQVIRERGRCVAKQLQGVFGVTAASYCLWRGSVSLCSFLRYYYAGVRLLKVRQNVKLLSDRRTAIAHSGDIWRSADSEDVAGVNSHGLVCILHFGYLPLVCARFVQSIIFCYALFTFLSLWHVLVICFRFMPHVCYTSSILLVSFGSGLVLYSVFSNVLFTFDLWTPRCCLFSSRLFVTVPRHCVSFLSMHLCLF